MCVMGVVTKSEFAARIGVSPSRLSHWLREGKVGGDAIVGSGYGARIDVEIARRQLDARLDLSQRLGANGKAKVGGESPDPADAAIKAERLAQLRHFNQRAAEEAALRAGAYVKATDARQQFGNIAARLMSTFEASFMPIANAIVASRAQTPRDVLRAMRSTWREVRAQAAKAQGEEALALPSILDSDADAAGEP